MGAISIGEYGDPRTQQQLLCDHLPVHKLDGVKTLLLVAQPARKAAD